jgi:hypothetical protein
MTGSAVRHQRLATIAGRGIPHLDQFSESMLMPTKGTVHHAGVNAPDLIDFITTSPGLEVTTEDSFRIGTLVASTFSVGDASWTQSPETRHRHMRYEMKEPPSG